MRKRIPCPCPVCQNIEGGSCWQIQPPVQPDYEFECDACGRYLTGTQALRWLCSEDEALNSQVRKNLSLRIKSGKLSENELPQIALVRLGTPCVRKIKLR